MLSKDAKSKPWSPILDEGERPIYKELYIDDKFIRRYVGGRPNDEYENILQSIAETLVKRIAETIARTKRTPQTKTPAPGDVTIGMVTEDLVDVRKKLADALKGHIGVHELEEKEISDADPAAPQTLATIKDKLARSKAFVQPYSFAMIRLPLLGVGGHLKRQQDLIPREIQTVWWRVSDGDGAVTADAANAERRPAHLRFLQQLPSQATSVEETCVILQRIIDGPETPAPNFGRILVESSAEDENTCRRLKESLEELWCTKFGYDSPIDWEPVPWSEVLKAGEEAIATTNGLIVVYGHKDYTALSVQLQKFKQLIFNLRRKQGKNFDIIIAVAVVPPQQWTAPIGSWDSFPFAPSTDNNFNERALSFLTKIRELVQARAARPRETRR